MSCVLQAESEDLLKQFSHVRIPIKRPLSEFTSGLLSRQYDEYVAVLNDVRYSSITRLEHTNKIPLLSRDFMGDDAYAACDTMSGIKLTRSYSWAKVNIYARILPTSSKPYVEDSCILASLILTTLVWLFADQGDSVTVSYCPFSGQKRLPVDAILGPAHVNSGSTLARGRGTIDVWRHEEATKVMIHEAIHSLRFDFKDDLPHKSRLQLYETFRIRPAGCSKRGCVTGITPNEAYVETVADIFNVFTVSHLCGINWLQVLETEREFALLQAAKVILYNDFKSGAGLLSSSPRESHWQQQSNVFSYYVIRAAFLYNLDRLVRFLSSNVCFPRLFAEHTDIETRKKRTQEYIEMVIEVCSDNSFLSAVDDYVKVVQNLETESLLKLTLRMTLYSIELQ